MTNGDYYKKVNTKISNNLFSSRFRLIHAVKPHTDRVCNIVTCATHGLIVTLSDDKTIFFFKFESSEKGVTIRPIRSVNIPDVALNIQFLSVTQKCI